MLEKYAKDLLNGIYRIEGRCLFSTRYERDWKRSTENLYVEVGFQYLPEVSQTGDFKFIYEMAMMIDIHGMECQVVERHVNYIEMEDENEEEKHLLVNPAVRPIVRPGEFLEFLRKILVLYNPNKFPPSLEEIGNSAKEFSISTSNLWIIIYHLPYFND